MNRYALTVLIFLTLIGTAIAAGLDGMPFNGDYRRSSDFGPRDRPCTGCSQYHPAHDYATPVGTSMRSTVNGTVSRVVTSNSGYGNFVSVISDSGNYAVQYSHLSSSNVTVGQTVTAGQNIALSGNSGAGTGAHLDYKVSVLDPATGQMIPVDPALAMGEDLDDPSVRAALVADSQAKLNGTKTTNVGDGTATGVGANEALAPEAAANYEGPVLGCDPDIKEANKVIEDALNQSNAEIIKASIQQPTPIEVMACTDQQLEMMNASGQLHANPGGDISNALAPLAQNSLMNSINSFSNNVVETTDGFLNPVMGAINNVATSLAGDFASMVPALAATIPSMSIGEVPSLFQGVNAPTPDCEMREQVWLLNECVQMPKIPSLSEIIGGKFEEAAGAAADVADPSRLIEQVCSAADSSLQGFFGNMNNRFDAAVDEASNPIMDSLP